MMRGVQLVEPGVTRVAQLDDPDPRGRAVVGVQTVGICGTDVSILAGKIPSRHPLVMGHEAVGVVEVAGPGGTPAVGRRVLVDPAVSCERCDLCRRRYPHLCRNGGLLGRDVDGVFADRVAVAENRLLPVPDEVSDDAAGLLQVLGTCVHAMSMVEVRPGQTAVVLGLGVGGQLIAQVLTARGATVIGVTRSPWKRDLAVELGAASAVDPAAATAAVEAATEGRGADLVVEAVGSEATFAQAIELAGAAGSVVLYGTATTGNAGLPYYQLYLKELTILCPRAATIVDYRQAIELVAGGTVRAESLVSARFALDEATEAFEAVRSPSTLKVLMSV